ncbi:MAG: hypothetical protein AB7I08_12340 [Thermoleophilia bacterium]
MTEETWGRLADRLEAAWPSPPLDESRRAVYYEVLRDLDDQAVEQAVTGLLAEDRDTLPPPGAIKTRAAVVAEASPAVVEPTAGGEASSDAVEPPAGTSGEPTGEELERIKRRPWLGVLFGIIGIFPVALWLGGKALADRKEAKDAGRKYPGETWAAVTALILGVWSVIWVAGVLIYVFDGGSNDGDSSASTGLEQTPDSGEGVGTPQDAILAVGDQFRDGNFAFRVVRAREVQQFEGATPGPGNALVEVVLETANLSSQPVAGPICISTQYSGVVLVDDQDRNYSVGAVGERTVGDTAAICAEAAQPGLGTRYVLAFEIPASTVPTIVGIAVWDPTEPDDPNGDSYYFVNTSL